MDAVDVKVEAFGWEGLQLIPCLTVRLPHTEVVELVKRRFKEEAQLRRIWGY